MVAAALVPVLIGVMGSFESHKVDFWLRLISIALSIAGTISASIEDVYQWRLRGHTRHALASEMQCLFQDFSALAGDEFQSLQTNEHGGEAFKRYAIGCNNLLREARRTAYVGQDRVTGSSAEDRNSTIGSPSYRAPPAGGAQEGLLAGTPERS